MSYPKLVIASDGRDTGILLDGVFFGQGIHRLEFVADGAESRVRLFDIDLNVFSRCGSEVEFSDFMENTVTLSKLTERKEKAAPAATGAAKCH